MPKRKCKFSEKYTEEFPFIKRGILDTDAHCTKCNSNLSVSHGGISDIKEHLQTEKHKLFYHQVEAPR